MLVLPEEGSVPVAAAWVLSGALMAKICKLLSRRSVLKDPGTDHTICPSPPRAPPPALTLVWPRPEGGGDGRGRLCSPVFPSLVSRVGMEGGGQGGEEHPPLATPPRGPLCEPLRRPRRGLPTVAAVPSPSPLWAPHPAGSSSRPYRKSHGVETSPAKPSAGLPRLGAGHRPPPRQCPLLSASSPVRRAHHVVSEHLPEPVSFPTFSG